MCHLQGRAVGAYMELSLIVLIPAHYLHVLGSIQLMTSFFIQYLATHTQNVLTRHDTKSVFCFFRFGERSKEQIRKGVPESLSSFPANLVFLLCKIATEKEKCLVRVPIRSFFMIGETVFKKITWLFAHHTTFYLMDKYIEVGSASFNKVKMKIFTRKRFMACTMRLGGNYTVTTNPHPKIVDEMEDSVYGTCAIWALSTCRSLLMFFPLPAVGFTHNYFFARFLNPTFCHFLVFKSKASNLVRDVGIQVK